MLILMASYAPGLSVGELFAGAMVPGVLLGLFYGIYVFFLALIRLILRPRSAWKNASPAASCGRCCCWRPCRRWC